MRDERPPRSDGAPSGKFENEANAGRCDDNMDGGRDRKYGENYSGDGAEVNFPHHDYVSCAGRLSHKHRRAPWVQSAGRDVVRQACGSSWWMFQPHCCRRPGCAAPQALRLEESAQETSSYGGRRHLWGRRLPEQCSKLRAFRRAV